MPTYYSNSYVPEESRFIAVMTPPGFIINNNKQDVISMQPSKRCLSLFFLKN